MNRRSIRKYSSEPLDEEMLVEILRAGMAAPSAHNQRPWHFVVIDDRSKLDAIMVVHPHSQMLREAPMAILVCGVPSKSKVPEYLPQDCSAAVMSMLIRITELGLGGVWLGVHPNPDRENGIRSVVSLPDGVVPFAIISVGHPDAEKGPSGRYDEDRVHRTNW
ncbi:MAG: nitroreductase family protein [Candidatus Methanomethylophilaceae archaeon]|nr:nitroreductase family protein [Candidatus Methanomethylophilaceae archaeon]